MPLVNAKISDKIAFAVAAFVLVMLVVVGLAIGHLASVRHAGGEAGASLDALYRAASGAVLICGLLSIAAAAGLWWLLTLSLAKPIAEISQLAQGLAAGDCDRDIPHQGRADEIGVLAGSLCALRTLATEKAGLEADTALLRELSEGERLQSELDREDRAREQDEAVAALANGLDHLADGDLTYRLRGEMAETYAPLVTAFNNAMEQLQQTVCLILFNADGIRRGSDEISLALAGQSRRTQHQSVTLDETTAALDEIKAAIRLAADGARDAKSLVAEGDADLSHQAAHEALAAVAQIKASAQELNTILAIIDGITSRTGELAVEARAEAGRTAATSPGLTKVAETADNLAQQTAEAADQIKALLYDTLDQFGSSAGVVDETGHALRRIAERVRPLHQRVEQIVAAAEDQATGLIELDGAVVQLDELHLENAGLINGAAAACHTLRQGVDELDVMIGRFQIGENRPGARPAPQAEIVGTAAGLATQAWDEF